MEKGLAFARWAGLGSHRYPIGFSGDTYMEWSSLAFQPEFTATAANVMFWWSHDIGGHRSTVDAALPRGHTDAAYDPELYLRWAPLAQSNICPQLLRPERRRMPLWSQRELNGRGWGGAWRARAGGCSGGRTPRSCARTPSPTPPSSAARGATRCPSRRCVII
jgi:hypothetical protein